MSPPDLKERGRIRSKDRDPLRSLSWAAYALILLTVGRLAEAIPALSTLPLVKVLLLFIVLAIVAHRKILPTVMTPDNPAFRLALVFAVWIVVSFSFSIWLGPSRDFILVQGPVICMIVLLICKLSGNWASVRNLVRSLVITAVILVVPGLVEYTGGRLEALQSTYDTNDLAYVLVGIIPAVLAFALTESTRTRRTLFYGVAWIMLTAIVLTGSRGGVIGLLVVGLLVVKDPGKLRPMREPRTRTAAHSPAMGAKSRIVLALAASLLIGIVSWPKLPPQTRERLATILSLSSDYNVSQDVGRMQIWKRGMRALADRPIGYGINSFGMVDYKYGGRFHTAHNSLVLVAVELGPVGITLYVAMLAALWRGLARNRRLLALLREPSDQQRQQAVFCRMLQVSLAGNVVAGQFLSSTYFYAHWVNIALAMAIILFMNGSAVEQKRDSKRVTR
jgi:hypothetical protein